MRINIPFIIGFFVGLFCLPAFAIQVVVHSSSPQVYALGFECNGKRHGGIGQSYTATTPPGGKYTFGVRVGGLMGESVKCSTNHGTMVMLYKDTNVNLNYNGHNCTAILR